MPNLSYPVFVTGSTGQVGSALINQLAENAVGLSRSDLDLQKCDEIIAKLDALISKHGKPSAFINACAYTAVDAAEDDYENALAVNGTAVGILSKFCFENDIPFVHYSTDYVFAGDGETAWDENSPVSPLGAYGKSKLEGEKHIQHNATDNSKWLIFRTSWVYNEDGKNFVNTMLRLAKDRDVLSVVNDQIGAPTYATDIASYTIKALENALKKDSFPSAIYHLRNEGETSWHNFANTIFELARKNGEELAIETVNGIPSSEYPTPAKRPLNSRMGAKKLKDVFDLTMPSWQDALARCLESK